MRAIAQIHRHAVGSLMSAPITATEVAVNLGVWGADFNARITALSSRWVQPTIDLYAGIMDQIK